VKKSARRQDRAGGLTSELPFSIEGEMMALAAPDGRVAARRQD
jgi:hypothetical protein